MTDDIIEVIKLIMNVVLLVAWWMTHRPRN